MELTALKNFSLVGGTALSLLYGHRKSIDLDLFSSTSFENDIIIDALQKEIKHDFDNRTRTPRFGIFSYISKAKVDIVRHPHPMIKPIITQGEIRMFRLKTSLP